MQIPDTTLILKPMPVLMPMPHLFPIGGADIRIWGWVCASYG
jgi:hypothetical protein